MSDQSKHETPLPDYKESARLKYVKLGFHYLISNGIYLLLSPMIVVLAAHLSTFSLKDLYILWDNNRSNALVLLVICSAVFVLLSTIRLLTRNRPVYLVDLSCYKPPDAMKCTKKLVMDKLEKSGTYTPENLEFLRKVLERSGISDSTYLPDSFRNDPPTTTLAEARKEAELVLFGAIDELLAKTGVKPRDISILIVNSGMFDPTPSLSAMVVNHYKMRENVLSYNLAGMGCSAGLTAIDLAKDLFQLYPNNYALIVTAENMTQNWYVGNDRSMLLPNCLFRMGGAAVLLSNKASDRRRAKYQLHHTVRTHRGADDKSYYSIYQQEDEKGNLGVTLSKELISVAGDALKSHITALGPLVLPLSEQLLFAASLVARKVFKLKNVKPYNPDFKMAIQHFCIHPGGKAVLDALEKNLQLSQWHMEPSRMSLYRFGNNSTSSVFYELTYTEAKGRVKKGDWVWQIAFGSGFKITTNVWKALRTINPANEKNPWMDEIHQFPVEIPKIAKLC